MIEVGCQQAISICQSVLLRWHMALRITQDDWTWCIYMFGIV